jgi:hypothetical protein
MARMVRCCFLTTLLWVAPQVALYNIYGGADLSLSLFSVPSNCHSITTPYFFCHHPVMCAISSDKSALFFNLRGFVSDPAPGWLKTEELHFGVLE